MWEVLLLGLAPSIVQCWRNGVKFCFFNNTTVMPIRNAVVFSFLFIMQMWEGKSLWRKTKRKSLAKNRRSIVDGVHQTQNNYSILVKPASLWGLLLTNYQKWYWGRRIILRFNTYTTGKATQLNSIEKYSLTIAIIGICLKEIWPIGVWKPTDHNPFVYLIHSFRKYHHQFLDLQNIPSLNNLQKNLHHYSQLFYWTIRKALSEEKE